MLVSFVFTKAKVLCTRFYCNVNYVASSFSVLVCFTFKFVSLLLTARVGRYKIISINYIYKMAN